MFWIVSLILNIRVLEPDSLRVQKILHFVHQIDEEAVVNLYLCTTWVVCSKFGVIQNSEEICKKGVLRMPWNP